MDLRQLNESIISQAPARDNRIIELDRSWKEKVDKAFEKGKRSGGRRFPLGMDDMTGLIIGGFYLVEGWGGTVTITKVLNRDGDTMYLLNKPMVIKNAKIYGVFDYDFNHRGYVMSPSKGAHMRRQTIGDLRYRCTGGAFKYEPPITFEQLQENCYELKQRMDTIYMGSLGRCAWPHGHKKVGDSLIRGYYNRLIEEGHLHRMEDVLEGG